MAVSTTAVSCWQPLVFLDQLLFDPSRCVQVCRACFWIWRKRRRQPQQQPEQHQQAEATATGDQAEGPATQADHGSSNGTLAGVDTAGAVAGTAGAVAGSAGTAAAADEVT